MTKEQLRITGIEICQTLQVEFEKKGNEFLDPHGILKKEFLIFMRSSNPTLVQVDYLIHAAEKCFVKHDYFMQGLLSRWLKDCREAFPQHKIF